VQLTIELDGASAIGDGDRRTDLITQLQSALRTDPRFRGAEIRVDASTPAQGTLGAHEILIFVGQDIALPLLVHALYDQIVSLKNRAGRSLKLTMTRHDLADGSRQGTLSIEGSPDDVIHVLATADEDFR
jgi:hypothetical protein